MSERDDELPALARVVAERLGCQVSAGRGGHCWFWIGGGARRSSRWLCSGDGMVWLLGEMQALGFSRVIDDSQVLFERDDLRSAWYSSDPELPVAVLRAAEAALRETGL